MLFIGKKKKKKKKHLPSPWGTYWWGAYMGNTYKVDLKEINQRNWSMWYSLFLRRPSKQCTTLLSSRTLIIAAMFGLRTSSEASKTTKPLG